MMDIIFWVVIGAFIGWNVPQPLYAKWIEERFRRWIGSFTKNENQK